MSKAEVIEYLGKSKRSVETYVSSGKLVAKYVNGTNGKTLVFQRTDVEAFKEAMDESWPSAGAQNLPAPATGIALVPPTSIAPAVDAFAGLAAHLAKLAAAYPTAQPLVPHMTLAEAVEYSGLPAAFLVAEARAGRIRAVNVGKGAKEFWRFAKDALAR